MGLYSRFDDSVSNDIMIQFYDSIHSELTIYYIWPYGLYDFISIENNRYENAFLIILRQSRSCHPHASYSLSWRLFI